MDIHRCRFVDYTPHSITASSFSHASDTQKVAPQGLRLAVGRANGDIEIWNPRYNWLHELTLPGARGRAIEGLVWSHAEGELPRLFSIGGSTYVTEWDLTTGRARANLNCNAGVIWCIDSNISGTKLAVGCDDGSVVVIDISGGSGVMEYEFICQRQDQRVLGLRWYGDDMLIGGCADGKVRCWGTKGEMRGKIISSMKVDKSKTEATLVWSIVPIPSRQQFVTGDSTGSVKFWDVGSFSLMQTFSAHDADVLSLSVDASSEKVFSAGIDRKIHQFSFLNGSANGNVTANANGAKGKGKKGFKWIHNYNRLLHSNDVRTVSLFESKAYNFLVSGGVERAIIVQSVENFQMGPYKKILMDQQISNISLCPASKLIGLFQDQTVKIWQLSDDKQKLVAKLSLVDDDNVTSVSIGEFEGSVSYLAVATINTVKLFTLTQTGTKLKVKKIRDEKFDGLISGAKKVFVYQYNRMLIQTPEDEIYTFKLSEDGVELDDEIESSTSTQSGNNLRAGFEHFNSIHSIVMSDDCSKIAVARFNNSVEILPLDDTNTDTKPHTLGSLANSVQLMAFTQRDTLAVLTEESKLYEFNVANSDDTLLSAWSQRNSDLMPSDFVKLETKPQAMFAQGNKVWIYGNQWLAFFDVSRNLEVNTKSNKRTNDGLSICDTDDFDASHVNLFTNTSSHTEEDDSVGNQTKPYWITQKYRPILKVDRWSDSEIIVIEREAFALPTASAFEVPYLKI